MCRFGDVCAGPGAEDALGARQGGPRTVHARRMVSWPRSCMPGCAACDACGGGGG